MALLDSRQLDAMDCVRPIAIAIGPSTKQRHPTPNYSAEFVGRFAVLVDIPSKINSENHVPVVGSSFSLGLYVRPDNVRWVEIRPILKGLGMNMCLLHLLA